MSTNIDYLTLISEVRDSFYLAQKNLTKKEIKFIGGKEGIRASFIGLFSFDYFKRNKLIKFGKVYYAYIVRIYQNRFNQKDALSTWLIYSPSSKFDSDPSLYERINSNLNDFISNKDNRKVNRKLYNALTFELSEPNHVILPKSLTEGELVYLSFVNLRKNYYNDFKLGLTLIIANKLISSEILYLPLDYTSSNYRSFYLGLDNKKAAKTE